jgi:hypothetical protein
MSSGLGNKHRLSSNYDRLFSLHLKKKTHRGPLGALFGPFGSVNLPLVAGDFPLCGFLAPWIASTGSNRESMLPASHVPPKSSVASFTPGNSSVVEVLIFSARAPLLICGWFAMLSTNH